MNFFITCTGDYSCSQCTTRVSDGFAAHTGRPKPLFDLVICLIHLLGTTLVHYSCFEISLQLGHVDQSKFWPC